MKNSFQLSIPKPCHENWDEFTPTPSGGFCASCQKNVRDFTQMSDTELIAFFKNEADKKNTSMCGRFRDDQLKKEFDINQWFPEWIVEGNQLFYEIPFEKLSENKLKIEIPQRFKKHFLRTSIAAMMALSLTTNAQNKIISGKITSAYDGTALPGVSIQIIGTQKGTTSNQNGEYSIEVAENQKIRFGFIGFVGQEITPKNAQNIDLKLQEDVQGEIVFAGKPLIKKKEKKQKPLPTNKVKAIEKLKLPVLKKVEPKTTQKIPVEMAEKEILLDEVSVYGYSSMVCQSRSGGVSIVNTISNLHNNNKIIEPNLPQPTQLSLYPNIAQDNEVFLKPEASQTEKTAFGEIESLEVYEYYSGKNFKITYEKVEKGELKLNIMKIPNGLYVVRLLQKNDTDVSKPIVSIARLVVER